MKDIGEDATGRFELHVSNFGYTPRLVYHTLFHIDRDSGKSTVRSVGSTPDTTCEEMVDYFTKIIQELA